MPDTQPFELHVAVKAMDLRFIDCPILVGTYEQDPIAGPQDLIDRELLAGALSQRRSLGLYAGPLGTASVVLRKPAPRKRGQGSLSGAVVTGLGAYDGALGTSDLSDAVRAGATCCRSSTCSARPAANCRWRRCCSATTRRPA